MKLLNRSMLVVLCSLMATTCFAQQIAAKQKVFATNPQTVKVDNLLLSNSITYSKGSVVNMDFSTDFHFTGTVFCNEQKYDNLHTVMIRSTDNPKSVLEITKITNKDNSIIYTGRIMNSEAADGYEIKNNNGVYSLQKFETNKIFEPCK